MELRSEKDINEKKRVALTSVLAAIFITFFKLIVGVGTGSLGILSEALHSGLDLLAAVITFLSVRISDRPADSDHHFGHGKIENFSAFIETILLLITCGWIIYEAIHRLVSGKVEIEVNYWSYIVVITSIVVDYSRSRALSKSAKKYNSQALEADALHFSTDIWSSGVVLLGLICANFGYFFADSIAALIVAFIVLLVSYRLGKRAVDVLLDKTPYDVSEKMVKISQSINTLPDVDHIDKIRLRRSGATTFVDLIVSAKRLISLDRSHDLADQIEAEVEKVIPNSDVIVHFHPSKVDESLFDTVRAVAKYFPHIEDIHNIRSYHDVESGRYFLSFHVKFDHSLSLEKAHNIVDTLEERLKKDIPNLDKIETHIETSECIGYGQKIKISEEKFDALKEEVMKDKRLKGIHDFALHKNSTGIIASCHILIDKELPLQEVHETATIVEEKIKKILPEIVEAIIHTEPSS